MAESISSPIFGKLGDYFGAKKIFIIACLLVTSGFFLISLNIIIFGSIILLIFRGAMASLGPSLIAQNLKNNKKIMYNLTKMQTYRDLGAALGPITTGLIIGIINPELQHLIIGVIFTWFYNP